MTDPQFAQTDRELWLAARLLKHGVDIHDGITTTELRRERMRAAIQRIGPVVICGRGKDGKPVTYAQAFERTYGVSIQAQERVA